jgi:spermidine synthase
VNAPLWLCFALSGVGALALELLWMRSAGLVLGTTAETAATVVAAYFAGLGLGAFLARRPARAPVRRYGWLEVAAAAGALGSFAVFRLLSTDAAQRALAAGGLGTRVAVVALTIVPVTVALGATLPILSHLLARPEDVGRRAGALYALNTLGAACGIAVMGFGLPAAIGVPASYLAAAASNALAGLIALWIGDTASPAASLPAPAKREEERHSHEDRHAPNRVRLWLVAGTTGLLGIGLEILWTVLFAQVLHNSVYSFAAVSLVFLLAIAVGAELSALLVRVVRAARIAAIGLTVAAVASVVGVWSFVYLTEGLRYFGMERGLPEYIARIVALAGVTAGPGTLAAATVLPALWAAFGERETAARPVGVLTAANLAGGVAGAVGAAFVVLPILGLRSGFLVAAVAYVILATVVADRDAWARRLAYAALLVVALLDPLRAPLTYLKSGETLRATAEGASGIVTVVDTSDDLQLRLDNYYVLGGSAGELNERRQGLIPLLLHPSPRRVAFIGMATGISASAAVALEVSDMTVIEVVPEVATMARTHFARWNARLLERPNVRLVVEDGRRYLAATASRFDVIVADLFIPWHASAGNLYALEMYAMAARRLAPGGVFCQWLPLYQMTREEFEVIARTFLTAFPQVTLWRNDFYPDRPVVGLVGAHQLVPLDLAHTEERLRRLPDWSRDSLLGASRAIAMLYLGDLSMVADLFARAPVNRDDHPVIEFLAPRLTRMNAAGDKDWFTGPALAEFTEALAERLSGKTEPLLPTTAAVTDARRAGTALFRYAIAAGRGDRVEADRQQDAVRRLVPEVVSSAEARAPGGALADARRTLGTLKSEQERLRRQLESMEQRLPPTAGDGGSRP